MSRNRKLPYEIGRWRLDEHQHYPSTVNLLESDDGHTADRYSDDWSCGTWLPLPVDQLLLTLVKYNVFRALLENKTIVDCLTMQCSKINAHAHSPYGHDTSFPRYSVVVPMALDLPGCLNPTSIQQSVLHSSWINYLPFPGLRDLLIGREHDFDHADLVNDLVGNLINLHMFSRNTRCSKSTSFITAGVTQHEECEATLVGTGLIVWGEPYLPGSWEAGAGFVRKWGWALAGCQELVESTNHWRSLRGEGLLTLPYRPRDEYSPTACLGNSFQPSAQVAYQSDGLRIICDL